MSIASLRRLLVLITMIAAALTVSAGTAAPGVAAPASARTGCGDAASFFYNIRAVHVSCPKAKRLANHWKDAAVQGEGDGTTVRDNVRVDGFRCHYASDTQRVRCRDGVKRVRFDFSPF